MVDPVRWPDDRPPIFPFVKVGEPVVLMVAGIGPVAGTLRQLELAPTDDYRIAFAVVEHHAETLVIAGDHIVLWRPGGQIPNAPAVGVPAQVLPFDLGRLRGS